MATTIYKSPWLWLTIFALFGSIFTPIFWFFIIKQDDQGNLFELVGIGFILGLISFAFLWGYYHFWCK
jgi:hypothetical protein